MKILVITHDKYPYYKQKKKMRWTRLPHHFNELGHKVRYITKREWLLYPLICLFFRPDVIISAGKIAGLITALHHKLRLIKFKKTLFVNDLTDHPHFYRSDKRIHFIVKNHDLITTPTQHNLKTYNCNLLISNGSDFTPIKAKPKYDVCYIGQVHGFYKIDELQEQCKNNNINLKIVTGLPSEEVPKYIAESKLCIYTISWDSSLKITDYAAMAKPVVAIKPNLAEKINYPAYYTKDLIKGIQFLLKNPKKASTLAKQNRQWFLSYSGTWKQQAQKYLNALQQYMDKK
jgi:hypothetical protein